MKMHKRMSYKLIPLIICLVTPGFALAQASDHNSEVFFNVGYGKLLDDETMLGNGMVVGFGYAYRLNRRWGLTLEGSRNNHLRDRSGEAFKFEGHAILAGGSLQYHFRPQTNVQPYLRFGLNFAHYKGTITRKTTVPPPGVEASGTQNLVGPDIGVGMKIFASRKISIRPEYRFAIHSGFHDYDPARDIVEPGLWAPRFTIGIGFHW